jgi:hypothetical protein
MNSLKCIKNINNNVQKYIDLLKINENNIEYGKIYYDKETDNIYFENKNKDIKQLSINTRTINILDKKTPHILQNDNICLFKGVWNDDILYTIDEIVIFENSIYINIQNNTNIKPLNNNDYWNVILNNTNDKINTVINPSTLKNEIIIDDSIEDLIYNNISSNGLFFVIFNNNDQYIYDRLSNTTVKNTEKHIEQNINNIKKIIIKKDIETIMLNLVGKSDDFFFDYISSNNSIHIIKNGFYKITYNIAYHGSVYNVKSMISIIDNNLQNNNIQHIRHSYNKSINRPINDILPDSYYEKEDDFEEKIMYINHSFILPLRNESVESNYQILLNLKFFDNNLNKIIYIHPTYTWMSIETILKE